MTLGDKNPRSDRNLYGSSYQTRAQYELALNKIRYADSKRCLLLDDQGGVQYANVFRELWEKFKGFIGFTDHTSREQIESRLIRLIEYGQDKFWIDSQDDIVRIQSVVNRVKIIPAKETPKIQKNLDEMISNLTAKIIIPIPPSVKKVIGKSQKMALITESNQKEEETFHPLPIATVSAAFAPSTVSVIKDVAEQVIMVEKADQKPDVEDETPVKNEKGGAEEGIRGKGTVDLVESAITEINKLESFERGEGVDDTDRLGSGMQFAIDASQALPEKHQSQITSQISISPMTPIQLQSGPQDVHDRALPLEPEKPKITQESLKKDLEGIKIELGVLRAAARGKQEKEDNSWLGRLFDRSKYWVGKFTPQRVIDWYQSALGWMTEGFRVNAPEQDSIDQTFLDRYGPKILELHERQKAIELSVKELSLGRNDTLIFESEALKNALDKPYRLTAFRLEYQAVCELLEQAELQSGDQEATLMEGGLDFSANSALALANAAREFEKLAAKHRHGADQKLLEEINRKCGQQLKEAETRLEDLMEVYFGELEGEGRECMAHASAALEVLDQGKAGDSLHVAQGLHAGIYSLKSLLDDCRAFVKGSESFSGIANKREEIEAFARKMEQFLQSLRVKAGAIKDIGSIEPSKEVLLAMRKERKEILSPTKKRRVWENKKFTAEESSTSPYYQLMRFFFFYLQAGHTAVQAMTTPVGRPTIQFWMQKMAEASRKTEPLPANQSYEFYLERARGLVEANDDFLNNYDAFLRGKMHIDFTPPMQNALPSPTDAEPALSSEHIAVAQAPEISDLQLQFREFSESYLPKGISDWFNTFFGTSVEDHIAWNRSEWQSWVHQNVLPSLIMREQLFHNLKEQFETVDPSIADKPPTDENSFFGFACYKMYMGLKDSTPKGREIYQHYLSQAKKIPAYQDFLQNYESYLQRNPPKPEPLPPEGPVAQPFTKIVTLEDVAGPPQTGLAPPPLEFTVIDTRTSAAFFANPSVPSMQAGIISQVAAQAIPSHSMSDFTNVPPERSTQKVDERVESYITSQTKEKLEQLEGLKKELIEVLTVDQRRLGAVKPAFATKIHAQLNEFQHKIIAMRKEVAAVVAEMPHAKTALPDVQTWMDKTREVQEKVENLKKERQKIVEPEQVAGETLQKFIESDPIPIDDKLLVHITGEFFAKDTGLEGYDALGVLNYRYAILARKIGAFSKQQYSSTSILAMLGRNNIDLAASVEQAEKEASNLLDKVLGAIDIHNHIWPSGGMKYFRNVDTAAVLLKSKLDNLKPGETLFFPGGWTTHAIYWEYTKQENGLLTLRLYNLGAGVSEFHPIKKKGYRDKALFLERVNIPIENVVQRPVIEAIRQISLPSKTSHPWTEHDIYNTILPEIGGEVSPRQYSQEDLRHVQRSGTCAFISLDQAMKHNQPNEFAAQHDRMELQLKAIVDYTAEHQNRLASEEVPRRALQKVTEETARNVRKNFNDGILTEPEFVYASKKISEVRVVLEKAEREYLSAVAAKAPQVTLEPVWLNDLELEVNVGDPEDIDKESSSISVPYHDLKIHSWLPDPKKLAADLSLHHENMEKALQEKDPLRVAYGFQKLMQKLPLQWKDADGNDLWASLPKEERLKTIEALSKIAKTGYHGLQASSQVKKYRKNKMEPQFFSSLYLAVTLSHKLLTGIDPELPMGYFSFYNYNYDNIFKMDRTFLVSYNPEADENFLQCDRYWKKVSAEVGGNDVWVSRIGRGAEKILTSSISEQEKLKRTPFFAWAIKFIKQSDNRAKLIERIPGFEKMHEVYQVMLARGDYLVIEKRNDEYQRWKAIDLRTNPRDIFPNYFYAFNDLFNLFETLDNKPVDSAVLRDPVLANDLHIKDDGEISFLMHYSRMIGSADIENGSIDYRATTLQRAISNNVPSGSQLKNAHARMDEWGLQSITHALTEHGVTGTTTQYTRMTDNQVVDTAFNEKVVDIFSLQSVRAIKNILNDSNRQILATFINYIADPGALTNIDADVFFNEMVFSPGLLLDELRARSAEVKVIQEVLIKLIHTGIQYELDQGRFTNIPFFLQLNEHLRVYFEYCGLPTEGLLDARKEINKLLERRDISDWLRFDLERTMLLSYNKRHGLTENEINEFLLSLFRSKDLANRPTVRPKENPQIDFALDAIIDALNPEIEACLFGPQGNFILNSIISSIYGDNQQRQWKGKPKFPVFSTVEGLYTVDIQNGLALKNEMGRVYVPADILAKYGFIWGPDFKTVGNKISNDAYEFQHAGSSYRIKDSVLQRLFTVNGKEEWLLFREYSKQDPYDYLLNKEKHFYWLSGRETQQQIIVTSRSMEPQYRLEFSSFKKKEVTTVHRLDQNWKDSGLVMFPIKNSPWKFLTHFERKGGILLWKDATSRIPTLIEMPYFGKKGLTFEAKEVNGKMRMCSKEYDGFFLAETQLVPELADMPNFLLLENAHGEKKVLLAGVPFEKTPGKGLDTLQGHPKLKDLEQVEVMEYSIDHRSGRLKPSSENSRLFLAYVYLFKMDYKRAEEFLRGFDSSLEPYSDRQIEILKWVFDAHKNLNDNDPRAASISLLAGYLLSKNLKDFFRAQTANVLSGPEVYEVYLQYLDQLNNLREMRLRPHEEIFLIDHALSSDSGFLNDPTFIKRKQELQPATGGEEQAKLSLQQNQTLITQQMPFTTAKTSFLSEAELYIRERNRFKVEGRMSDDNVLRRLGENAYLRRVVRERLEESYYEHQLLKPYLSPFVIDAYALVRGELGYWSGAEAVFKKITGLPSMPSDEAIWKAELHQAFRMMTKMVIDDARRNALGFAFILDAVLTSPDKFMSSQQFKAIWWYVNENNYEDRLMQKIDTPGSFFNDLDKIIATAAQVHIEHSLPSSFETAMKSQQTPSAESTVPLRSLKPKESQTASPFQLHAIDLTQPYQTSLYVLPPKNNLPLFTLKGVADIVRGKIEPIHALSAQRAEASAKLQQRFQVKAEDPIVARDFADTAASIARFQTSLPNYCPGYAMRDERQFKLLMGDMRSQVDQRSLDLNRKEMELLMLANRMPLSEVGQSSKQMEAIGEGTTPMTIDDLIQLFWRRDALLFHQRNDNLLPEEISRLQEETYSYLIDKTQLQHQQRLINQMQAIVDAQAAQEPALEIEELFKQFVTMATAERAYDPRNHPEYLVLEFYADILMRPEQAENMDLLSIKDGRIRQPEHLGVIVEMIMGAGKTSVLMPLLTLLYADGEHLALGVIPETLLATQSKELTATLAKFKQSVQVLDYSPASDINQLEYFLETLEGIIKKRQGLLMTLTSIESLYLKFMSTIKEAAVQQLKWGAWPTDIYNERMKYLYGRIDVFSKIFTLFGERGRLILDEADWHLNPRRDHHLTVGSPEELNSRERDMVFALYEIMTSKDDLGMELSFEFLPNDKGVLFSKEYYHQHVKARLIKVILSKQFGLKDKYVKELFEGMTPERYALIERYLSNDPDPTIFQQIKDVLQGNWRMLDILSLAKEEINLLIPLTFSKICDVHYGIAKASGTAVPFRGSDYPTKKSDFGTPYEILNFTIQSYLKVYKALVGEEMEKKGIALDLVEKEIKYLQKIATKEMKKKIPLKDTEAQAIFELFTGKDPNFTLFGAEKQLEALRNKINLNPHSKLYFVRHYISRKMKSYPEIVSANPQLVGFLFSDVNGFTGRNWNDQAFPIGLQSISSDTVVGKTLSIVDENSRGKVHIIDKPDPARFMQDFYGKYPQLRHATVLIDAAGMMHGGLSQETMARESLHFLIQLKGMSFYDGDNQMIVERGRHEPIPLSQSTLKKEDRGSIYDQRHCIGAHILQMASAVATMTVDEHMTLHEFLQALWRMRGFDKSQRVEFVFEKETKALFIEALKKIPGIEPEELDEVDLIMLYFTYNEALVKGDNNFRALKQQMKAVLQAEAFAVMRDLSVDAATKVKVFMEIEELFVTKVSQSPSDMFGTPQVEEESAKVVEAEGQRWLNSKAFNAFKTNPVLVQRQKADKIEKSLKKIADESPPKLTKKLLTAQGKQGTEYGRAVEIEVEKESEKEHEREMEREKEVEKLTAKISQESFQYTNEEIFKDIDIFDPTEYEPSAKDSRKELSFFTPVASLSADDPTNVFDDPHLKSSLNLQPIHKGKYSPFFDRQKAVADVLVVEDTATSAFKIIMLDTDDAVKLRKQLQQDQGEFPGRACLYNFVIKVHQSGVKEIKTAELENNPKFLAAIVQAKFFNGETEYSEQEIPHLKAWIERKGPQLMLDLFRNKILKYKDDSYNNFPYSTIAKVFKELGLEGEG